MRSLRAPVLAAAWLVACAGARPPAEPAAPAPAEPAPPPAVPACERIERIEVHKAARTLLALCEGGARKTFPVALSRQPIGPKRRSGDDRTPEGQYRLIGKPRPSRFHYFVQIDYPSRADAEVGLRTGVIGRRVYREILAAHDAGRLPPQDSGLGGVVGFHGEGERWRGASATLDWTRGCFALADEHIDFLIARAPAGTPVTIAP
jgi:murein L,D-transpeptidase YafK